jgi:hypothetical protein
MVRGMQFSSFTNIPIPLATTSSCTTFLGTLLDECLYHIYSLITCLLHGTYMVREIKNDVSVLSTCCVQSLFLTTTEVVLASFYFSCILCMVMMSGMGLKRFPIDFIFCVRPFAKFTTATSKNLLS